MKCPNCGETSRIRVRDKFCHKCGCNLKTCEVKKTKVESERITNISELEQIVQSARSDAIYLKKAIKDENKEVSAHLVEQLDLKLHQIEVFDFNIERRTIIAKA